MLSCMNSKARPRASAAARVERSVKYPRISVKRFGFRRSTGAIAREMISIELNDHSAAALLGIIRSTLSISNVSATMTGPPTRLCLLAIWGVLEENEHAATDK